MKKVVYVSYQPITEYTKSNFYIDKVKEEGFDVEYWDLTNIFFPGILERNYSYEAVRILNTYKELESKFKEQKNVETIYVLIFTYEYRTLKFFRILQEYKCKTIFFARGAIPSSVYSTPLRAKLLKAINPSRLKNFILNKYAAYQKKKGDIKPYDLILNAGKLGFVTIGMGSEIEVEKSEFIDINSIDYDKYQDTINVEDIVGYKYGLFLDTYFPKHPDMIMLGIKTMSPKDYYADINKFFDFLEFKYKTRIVIAAHPKAEDYRTNNPFNGRKVIFNKTAELSRHCDFAMTHMSTSVSYSVLNKKPVLFLTSNQFKSIMPDYDRWIANLANVLGGSLVDMDNLNDMGINISTVNQEKYDDYKFQYLTSKGSENKTTKEIFVNLLKETL